MKNKIIVGQSEAGERIDTFLSNKLDYSRSSISQSIKAGLVLVNNQPIKPNYKTKLQDVIELSAPKKIASLSAPKGENIPLDIVFENNDILVINKQAGLVVHPAAGHESGTLVNAIIKHFPEITSVVHNTSNIISKIRPGLVHRLDKDTTGIIMIAKNERTLRSLSKQIKNRTVKKKYIGICFGWPKYEKGRLVNFLGRHPKDRKRVAEIGKEKGKEAILNYSVTAYYTDSKGTKFSLVEFNLLTGRTHQIRVQSYMMGNPIIGDVVYCSKNSLDSSKFHHINRQLLHAKEVSITLPGDDKATTFEAKVPLDLLNFIKSLTVHNFS